MRISLLIVVGVLLLVTGCVTDSNVSNEVSLTISVPQSGFIEEVTIKNGTTAFDVFNQTLNLNYSTHPVYGNFISGINEVEQNTTHYWQYYVDGELGQVGVDNYLITESVTLEWRLETVPETW